MIIKFIISVIIFAILVSGGYCLSENVTYSYLTDLLSVLQNTSAMIFAIAGIWLAYLYPNAIAGLMKSEKVDFLASKNEAKRIEGMIFIIILSAFVLVLVILFYTFNAILRGSDLYYHNKDVIKGLGVSYVAGILYVQLYCVTELIRRNVSFINRLYSVINEKELEEKL
ncbi:hypothetical protein [Brenneria corticis]|uniref:Uncharacterized protein n=1 Tax=Brenneria corticis TaxID=2173106 RepID=A0A2U1TNN9_9GAMM|nr:hypothetical protein [Brenneria sp. CFCC 11842]PWC10999.1 hypothetical protein DDT56_20400 [Brenneria sp. CFCC 11842]